MCPLGTQQRWPDGRTLSATATCPWSPAREMGEVSWGAGHLEAPLTITLRDGKGAPRNSEVPCVMYDPFLSYLLFSTAENK